MKEQYVNFGCGGACVDEFLNYDGSFNLRMQRNMLVGGLVKKMAAVKFPALAIYGDIIKGLPVKPGSLKGIYSSHVLEHLALDELRKSIRNCYAYLQPGGIFRSVLPNMEEAARSYLRDKEAGNKRAAYDFMHYTFLGYEHRPTSLKDIIKWRLSGHHHFWMWDYEALEVELLDAGFSKVTRSAYHQSADSYFNHVEVEARYDYNALCFEAVK